MLTDLMVMLMPVPIIWKLNLPISQRIVLTATFSLGLFITAMSIIRLKSLMNISFTDPTWTLPLELLWTVLSKILTKEWTLSPSSWRSRSYGNDNFTRLQADTGVPLQTISGGSRSCKPKKWRDAGGRRPSRERV
ncbi:uncharacterized protein GGS22DRAFT_156099, partial [Annulohypoxylon maeteangense]|uniref:uncharacterized protein n=1 Tax=Annulohypoxylon maeteangense TaxID=1927788 RepID=UPI002007CBC5